MAGSRERRVVIGIGNPDRGDDAAGRMVARRLAGAVPADVEVAEMDGEATAVVDRLQAADAAILIDACVSGASPGTVRRLDAASEPLPDGAFGMSTHGFGLTEAVALARALGQLPVRCVVYAIEGESFAPGAPLSPAVAAAVEAVAERLRAELAGRELAGETRHA